MISFLLSLLIGSGRGARWHGPIAALALIALLLVGAAWTTTTLARLFEPVSRLYQL